MDPIERLRSEHAKTGPRYSPEFDARVARALSAAFNVSCEKGMLVGEWLQAYGFPLYLRPVRVQVDLDRVFTKGFKDTLLLSELQTVREEMQLEELGIVLPDGASKPRFVLHTWDRLEVAPSCVRLVQRTRSGEREVVLDSFSGFCLAVSERWAP